MEIENWGFNSENEVMKGYILYALKEMEKNEPQHKLTAEQKAALFNGLRWATSDLTAEEAYNYYCNNQQPEAAEPERSSSKELHQNGQPLYITAKQI